MKSENAQRQAAAFQSPNLRAPLTDCERMCQKKSGSWELIGVDLGCHFQCSK